MHQLRHKALLQHFFKRSGNVEEAINKKASRCVSIIFLNPAVECRLFKCSIRRHPLGVNCVSIFILQLRKCLFHYSLSDILKYC